jgi:hypothetical protein
VIIIVCALIAVGIVPLFGGKLSRMGTLPIRWPGLVWLAIGTQTLLVSGPWEFPRPVGQWAHLVTYAVAATFAVINIRLPGVAIISLGGLANLAAIAANSGVMPASPGALRLAGLHADTGFTNSGAVAHPRLAWLGDVFAVPAGWPLANVFSVGDVAIVIGIGVLAHVWCTSTDADVEDQRLTRASSAPHANESTMPAVQQPL